MIKVGTIFYYDKDKNDICIVTEIDKRSTFPVFTFKNITQHPGITYRHTLSNWNKHEIIKCNKLTKLFYL